ncbi:interleukin-15 receptor subunit alpha isoform X13 [Oreochromis niloticus]|uniref:interleukin-15 receptor subunit alpha isoform X13 n=1 Tax=Oreochromis niloticus TaxID=8128 RepID=UPI000DF489CE|nr:interleukin-15 receptor subunit alpha isoform X13 [Oreochromis niloticus]CAI5637362.1 unnamed protein product [Mustela putorius furo]
MALVSLAFSVCVMIVCWPQLSSSGDPRITTTQPPKATRATTTESRTDISHYSISTSAIKTVMETTGKTDTIQNATVSPRRADNTTPSTLKIDPATTTAATVTTVLLVILCTAGIVLLYRRRRREHIPVNQDPEDL